MIRTQQRFIEMKINGTISERRELQRKIATVPPPPLANEDKGLSIREVRERKPNASGVFQFVKCANKRRLPSLDMHDP